MVPVLRKELKVIKWLLEPFYPSFPFVKTNLQLSHPSGLSLFLSLSFHPSLPALQKSRHWSRRTKTTQELRAFHQGGPISVCYVTARAWAQINTTITQISPLVINALPLSNTHTHTKERVLSTCAQDQAGNLAVLTRKTRRHGRMGWGAGVRRECKMVERCVLCD